MVREGSKATVRFLAQETQGVTDALTKVGVGVVTRERQGVCS